MSHINLMDILISKVATEKEEELLTEKNIEENEEEDTCSDWDILNKIRKGSDRTNNDNITLLKKLQLAPNIFKLSLDFYEKTVKNLEFKRTKFKQSIMCACVLLAFAYCKENKYEEDTLLKYFGVDKVKYTKGLTLVKTAVKEVRGIQVYVAENIIHTICRQLNIVECIPNIKEFIDGTFSDARSRTLRVSDKSLHCALIYVWMLKNKRIIPTVCTFSNICNISATSMIKIILKNKVLVLSNIQTTINEKMVEFKSALRESFPEIKSLQGSQTTFFSRSNYFAVEILKELLYC